MYNVSKLISLANKLEKNISKVGQSNNNQQVKDAVLALMSQMKCSDSLKSAVSRVFETADSADRNFD